MKTARDIMTEKVITVTQDTPIEKLSELFIQHGINGLPVVDEGGQVIGVVRRASLLAAPRRATIESLMENPVTVPWDAPVSAAETAVQSLDGSPPPVVDPDGRLMGQISI